MGQTSATSLAPFPDAADSCDQDEFEHQRHQYLTFTVARELYAIGILRIKEIIEYAEMTVVPLMPACVRGVINLRGAVVPVLDLSARFGQAPVTPTARTCIVIVETHAAQGEIQDLGVIVDSVNEVVEIPSTEVEPAPSLGTRIADRFIAGMGKIDGRFVILLDVERVLAPEDIVGVSAAAGGRPEGRAA